MGMGVDGQGVAAETGLELVVPAPQLCTDNGVMVAWAGVERLALGLWEHLPASSQDDDWVDVRPRWPLTDQCVSPTPSALFWQFCWVSILCMSTGH